MGTCPSRSDYVPTLSTIRTASTAPALGTSCRAGLAGKVLPAAAGGPGRVASIFPAASAGFSRIWRNPTASNAASRFVQRRLPAWPEDKLLLVLLPDRYVADKAPVFDAY